MDNLTVNHTVLDSVSKEFEQILRNLKHQPPFIHDIRIGTITRGLYEGLLQKKIPNKVNKGIHLVIPLIDSRFKCKVSIYRRGRLLVMLGCTQNPLPYSPAGFSDLIEYLAKVSEYLRLYSQTDYVCDKIRRWRISYYHFNKDGKTIDSPFFKYCIEDLGEHSRTYLHKTETGETVLRHEETKSLDESIEDEKEKTAILKQDKKEAEWYDDETDTWTV
jgi:hypothetical protein